MDAFRQDLTAEIQGIWSNELTQVITETRFVPNRDDSDITYPNLITGVQKCKLLESAVLFVDLRNSTSISLNNGNVKLSRLYSAYIRAMVRCAHFFNGHVRNIIGDRVMVVFDRDNCFANASHTATLMNTVVQYILDPNTPGISVNAGIGIDYGQMLVTKTGIVKRGTENTDNKSLVWLGKPANVASKLTDAANKLQNEPEPYVVEGHYYDALAEWGWYQYSMEAFIDRLTASFGTIKHESSYFSTFFKSQSNSETNPPILMTKSFYEGLAREHPDLKEVRENFWTGRTLKVRGYSGEIMGGNVYYPVVAGE